MPRAVRRGKRANGEGSIYQRGDSGKWVAQVPTGRYANGTIKYKRYTVDTQRAARDLLRKAQHSLAQGQTLTSQQVTVAEYLAHWLTQVIEPSDLEPQAKLAHQYQVGLLTSRLGHLKLNALTPEHVETCLNDLRRNGGRNSRGYAASTVAHTRNTLRKALGHAVKNGRLTRNVAAYATPPKVRRPEVRPFTEEEAGRLLDTVAGHRLDTLYAVALTLGLRRGELLGLTWQDIDWQSATLHVRRQLEVLPGVKPHLKELLKTQAGRRDLTIPPDLLRRLREHQDRQHGERETAGADWQDHGLVFPTSVGTPILPRNLARHYERLLHHAGLPQRRVHDLRHTFATLMFKRGLDVVKVSRMLGHASVQITIDTYIHWLPKESGEAAAIMDDFLLRRQRAVD